MNKMTLKGGKSESMMETGTVAGAVSFEKAVEKIGKIFYKLKS